MKGQYGRRWSFEGVAEDSVFAVEGEVAVNFVSTAEHGL